MRVVVNEFMSLDGVAQAPGGAEEDTDGGFTNRSRLMQLVKCVTTGTGVQVCTYEPAS